MVGTIDFRSEPGCSFRDRSWFGTMQPVLQKPRCEGIDLKRSFARAPNTVAQAHARAGFSRSAACGLERRRSEIPGWHRQCGGLPRARNGLRHLHSDFFIRGLDKAGCPERAQRADDRAIGPRLRRALPPARPISRRYSRLGSAVIRGWAEAGCRSGLVLRHQQPAGEPLVHFGSRVADRRCGLFARRTPERTSTGNCEGTRSPASPGATSSREWSDPFRAPGYRWRGESDGCRARQAARSSLRGRSIRPRLPCRCVERRRRMQSPSRENRRASIFWLGCSSIFRTPRVTGLEARREQIEVARREGRKQCVAAERHRGAPRISRREHRSLAATDACGLGRSRRDVCWNWLTRLRAT